MGECNFLLTGQQQFGQADLQGTATSNHTQQATKFRIMLHVTARDSSPAAEQSLAKTSWNFAVCAANSLSNT
eukprot:5035616-Amphidinium_carterae.1